jgi:two-component system, OmpR family, response regulator
MTLILCVDDNAELVELLSELLKMVGYETRTAPGGEECLRILNENGFHPDLILLDIMMEPMDGWETLQHIRGQTRSRDIPVVMLTGKYPTMTEAETYGPLIDNYLMKPYHPHQVDELIRHILTRTGHLREVIQNAREHGIDEGLCGEYMRLVPTVEVMKRFREIISGTEHFNDDLLVKAESRLANIQEQFLGAGVQV